MTQRHYIAGSVLVALLGIGFVVYLVHRKPQINVSGVIEAGTPTVTFTTWTEPSPVSQETKMDKLIRQSNAAIAADDAEQAKL